MWHGSEIVLRWPKRCSQLCRDVFQMITSGQPSQRCAVWPAHQPVLVMQRQPPSYCAAGIWANSPEAGRHRPQTWRCFVINGSRLKPRLNGITFKLAWQRLPVPDTRLRGRAKGDIICRSQTNPEQFPISICGKFSCNVTYYHHQHTVEPPSHSYYPLVFFFFFFFPHQTHPFLFIHPPLNLLRWCVVHCQAQSESMTGAHAYR